MPQLCRLQSFGGFLQHERLDLTLPLPFISACNQAGTHGVLPHVIPLLTIALARAQHVIKELFLPDSSGEIELARYPLACPLLPCPHKERQFLRIQFGSAKEMNMIGHDHIAANCPTVTIVRIPPFIGQNPRNFIGSENWPAFKSARCDEIGRPIDPNAFEPAQMFAHYYCC